MGDATALEQVRSALPGLLEALGQTALMAAIVIPTAVVIGTLLGLLLFATRPGGLAPSPRLYAVVNAVVNLTRSFPFLILLIALIPVTRIIVGTSVGTLAATVPLAVSATAYLARFVEQNLLAVPPGVVEAARSLGAGRRRTLWSVALVVGVQLLGTAAVRRLDKRR